MHTKTGRAHAEHGSASSQVTALVGSKNVQRGTTIYISIETSNFSKQHGRMPPTVTSGSI